METVVQTDMLQAPSCTNGSFLSDHVLDTEHREATQPTEEGQSDMMRVRADDLPYIPECELFQEGGPDAEQRFQSCDCKSKFIPVNGFTLEHLPERFRSKWNMTQFKNVCDRTVKLKVKFTSENRPHTYPDSTAPYPYSVYKGNSKVVRCGTGFMYDYEMSNATHQTCPCPECKHSGEPMEMYYKVKVCTAAHVVFDDLEADKTVCEVFYDSKDRKGVRVLYGVKGVKKMQRCFLDRYENGDFTERCENDLFYMECVTHDAEFYKLLKCSITRDSLVSLIHIPTYVIVSHPHGWSKQVSIGNYRDYCFQFSKSHSADVPYFIPADTTVISTTSVMSKYPGLFESYPDINTWFRVLQPLNVYIKCNSANTTIFGYNKEGIADVAFPRDSIVTSNDGKTKINGGDFKIGVEDLFCIFKDNLVSYHMIYDIPTCNGSSGATVSSSIFSSIQFLPCHLGKLPSGINRSGSYTKGW